MSRRRCEQHQMAKITALWLVLAVLGGHASAASPVDTNSLDQQNVAVTSAAAASAAAASTGKASLQSACAKQCFETAKKLGFDRVAGDSLACFLPYKGKTLSTYDCCNKAEGLLGAQGPMAGCLCCPEFAKAILGSLPYSKLGTTTQSYLEKLHLCRVPTLGQSTCTAVQPPSNTRLASTSPAAPAPAAPDAQAQQQALTPKPLIEAFNLTGLYPWVGFDTRFDPGVLAAQGQAAVTAGQIDQIQVVGASPLYNDYITGFVMWIERETPRYNTPKMPNLPPLPEQYKDDVMWVANLRRGPYPDLVKNRPAEYSPQKTDPLQNGEIANLPPGPAFAGRLSTPPASSP